MDERAVVILVECREPGEESVVCFVASSWARVDTFVADPENYGFSNSDYYWWAQENVVDETDITRNLGRVRTYDKKGLLMDDMPE